MTPGERHNAEMAAQRAEIAALAQQQAARPVYGAGLDKNVAKSNDTVRDIRDTVQDDLAAGRAAIAGQQFAKTSGVRFERAKDLSFVEAGAQVVKAMNDARVPGMLYESDRDTKAQPSAAAGARDYRIVRAICPACEATFTLAQSLPWGSDEWTPNDRKTLDISGWQWDADANEWTCGKWCLDQQRSKRKGHANLPLPVVGVMHDRDNVKRLYATAPAAPTAVKDETTPAVAPQLNQPAQAPTHKGHPSQHKR